MEEVSDILSLRNGIIISAIAFELGTTSKYFIKKGQNIFLEAVNLAYEAIWVNPENISI